MHNKKQMAKHCLLIMPWKKRTQMEIQDSDELYINVDTYFLTQYDSHVINQDSNV